jgi:hypothetical protein
MEMKEPHILVMIPAEELESLKQGQQQILEHLNQLRSTKVPERGITPSYVTAQEFMQAVHIRRWKFDQLIAGNKIKAIKKKRKIYVLASEIERYFSDPSIQ